jgi:polyhydroxybutyrate depolymerase
MNAMCWPSVCRVLLLLGVGLSVPCWAASSGVWTETFQGREMLVYVPKTLPESGTRALVVVLHGGLGNASRIEDGRSEGGLNMDKEAERDGFLVVYLNGTRVMRLGQANMLGWNAGGGCCGVPAQEDVDDVGYISAAVRRLVAEYGVDARRVYGLGHSNGAMMTMRMVCETEVYAAAVSVAGPLNLVVKSCQYAKGKRVLAIHGERDENVPIAGGQGTKGLSRVAYRSEAATEKVMDASGAKFTLQVVPGADHKLDDIEAVIRKQEGMSLGEKVASFFGLRVGGS